MKKELNARLWILITAIVILLTVIVALKLRMNKSVLRDLIPAQSAAYSGQGSISYPGVQQNAQTGRQAAFSPNCATCPNFTQCFPNAGQTGQQAAFSPNCATCPNFTQCFPNAGQTGQQAAFQGTMTAAPPIFRDAQMPHEYRGVCSNCHVINPDIPIRANAQMPHEYRGVCSNCHVISQTGAGTM